jgi:Mitochondrial carrier protein
MADSTQVMLAGGLGGTMGDMMMHSLDTVKTRQQGDPRVPPKYVTLGPSYRTILTQEGFSRGLYAGVLPALLGSFSGTMVFFGSYELCKRALIDKAGVTPSIAYFTAGVVADVAASPLYVPSEVLKTRLQLQGRFNNPWFPESGYNYRGSGDALKSIVRHEGIGALFYGYKATLYRDVPFSALQFLFYEQEQNLAKFMVGGNDIGLGLELLTGASAGCMAGVITCPLDVVKTRIQTQVNPSRRTAASQSSSKATGKGSSAVKISTSSSRHISTSSPSTTLKPPSAATLDTSSVLTGLRIIYRTEGTRGLFRGVGPRAVWTSFQSGCMFLMYQTFLKWFETHPLT